MQNRNFIVAMVVVIAIFIGVAITMQQSNSPLLRRLINQQNEMLKTQKSIEERLGGSVGTSSSGSPAFPVQQFGQVVSKQATFESRISQLEKKIDELTKVVTALPKGGQAARAQEDPDKVYTLDVAHSPIRGNKDAEITIVEFVDFQCPFCSRFHPVVDSVLEEYPKDVRYVMKNYPLPFHPEARPAAKAALAAGEQGKYWEMTDLLLSNTRKLGAGNYEEFARSLGLDLDKFKSDLEANDEEWEKLINTDMQLGQQVNVRGTPTFYLNGKKTQARDLPSFKREIDPLL